jgi:hypothetical protein
MWLVYQLTKSRANFENLTIHMERNTPNQPRFQILANPNFIMTKIINTFWCNKMKTRLKTRPQPNQTIISFYRSLFFGCKIAHWKVGSNLYQILIGHFCKLLKNSSIFVFQSRHSSNLGWREYFLGQNIKIFFSLVEIRDIILKMWMVH